MGQLGSRLSSLSIGDDAEDVTVEMLVESEDEGEYVERLQACKSVIQAFLPLSSPDTRNPERLLGVEQGSAATEGRDCEAGEAS